ncbi:hypothetical protein BD626DRAFT_65202 [Schizophyllum amplum]|uniref:DUF6593 domain-containing protein n=1 Tax=Schizophyllum amplum TaxID=97359 RepID=A0A550CAX4_9AGAR|nr:hypothetical protein BD626DRAFT_65202 [Auriculariopsis ampla]
MSAQAHASSAHAIPPTLAVHPIRHSNSGSGFNQPGAPLKFIFKQKKKYDDNGIVVDEHGRKVYGLRDEGKDHTFGGLLSYPLHITRADGSKVGSVYWEDNAASAKLLPHTFFTQRKRTLFRGNPGKAIMDTDFAFTLPDARTYEWDLDMQAQPMKWRLLDHQHVTRTGSGLDVEERKRSVAVYMHRVDKTADAMLEILPEALWMLDACVMTVFHLEQYMEENSEAFKRRRAAGKQFGEQIGQIIGAAVVAS